MKLDIKERGIINDIIEKHDDVEDAIHASLDWFASKNTVNVDQQTLNAPASTESTPQIICEKTACNCHSIDKKNRCLQYTDYGVDSCSFRK